MEQSALALEVLKKTGALMKTSFWPKKANAFIHGEMFILNHIAHCGESVIPSQLAAAMHASSARVAMALKSLEAKGYVTRRIDASDRRKVNVFLTPQGYELIKDHKEEMQNKMKLIVSELGEKDTREYIRIVERMTEIARSLSDETEETARSKEHLHG